MASLSEILNDPNYVNANEETKAAIFTKYAPQDENYTQANAATQAAIRNRFGVEGQPGIGARSDLDTSIYSSYQGLKGGLAGLAGRLGIMDVEKAKQIQEEAEEKGKKAFKPIEGGWSTDFSGKFVETLGQSIPYMIAPIAAAGVATAAGAPGAVATGVSGLASAIQFAGSNLQRQQERGIELEDTNLAGAIATAIPQAALETLSFRMIPGVQRLFGKAGKEITEAQAAEIAKQGIVRSTAAYGAQGARTGGIEGMTEVGQQFLERLQAGLTLGDQDAINEFVESFVGGTILGGTISMPGTAMRRDQARQMAAQAPKAPETPAEEQETIETAPPAAPPVTPPVALTEGVPSDVALDQAAMEEEFQRSQGQLPIKPAQVAQTTPAQITQATPAQAVQVEPPELELPLGASPESAEQRALPPIAQPAQPKIVQPELVEQPIAEPVSAQPAQPAQIEQPEIVQPVDPNAEARLAVEPVEPVAPSEPPPVAQKKVTKAAAPKAGEKILSAHEFIASLGGLDKKEAAEIDKDAAKSNVRIGNKWLYASKGGLSAGQAAEKLAEAGYIQVEDNNEVYRVINDSLIDPVYSINDADAIAERKFAEQAAEEAARFAEKEAAAGVEAQEVSAEVAAEQAVEAADLGNFRQQMLDAGYTEQDLNVIGFTKASPELQAEVAALEKQVSEAGLDPSEILEVLNRTYGDQLITKQEYYAKAKDELAKAIREKAVQGGGRDVSQADVQEGAAREEGLTSPSEQELYDQQEAAYQADVAKAKADREAEANAKADAERKEIAARSEKAAGEFELGKTAEEDLSGQKDIFSTPVQISPEQQKIDVLNKLEAALAQVVPPFRGAGAAGTFFYTPKPLSDKQIALIKDLASEAIDLGMPAFLLEDILASGATRMNAVAAIASKKGWLVLGGQWSSASRIEKLKAIIHELGHSVDAKKARVSNSDVWQKAHDELKKWHGSSATPTEHPLAYPFDKQFSGKTNIKQESFAQAFSLYFVSPVELQVNAPEAYSQIQSIVEGIQNESQRTRAASATKTGATEVKVQQPRAREGAEVQSEVGEVGAGVRQDERSKDRDDQRIKDKAGQDRQKDIQKIAEKAGVPPALQKPADFVLKEGRIEEVVLAARALAEGKITKDEYDAYVDAHAPITTIPNPEGPLSVDGMKLVLKSNQVGKINPKIKDGTRVGIRMDINALKRARALSEKTGKKVSGSVVSIHEGSDKNTQGDIIGYSAAASIKNARFAIRNEQKAFKVAQGIEDKSPQQTIEGEWVNISPEDAYARIKSLLKDPKWAQVSLDPLRHSFFYDRSNKRPVVSADEILQVGRFVLAKNVKYAEREEFLYSQAPKKPSQPTLPGVAPAPKSLPLKPKPAATWQSLEPMTWKDTRAIELFDKHRNLDLVQKEITKIVGEIGNDLNAYRAETLAHGRAERQVKDFLSLEFRPIIKEMKDGNITDEALTEYLVMRHAKEANDLIAKRNPNDATKQDKGSGVSYQQREDYFKALDPVKKKVFESIAKKVDGILKKTRDLLEEGGVITKEQKEAWESLFEFYVPLRREESDYSLPSSSYRRVGDYAKSRTGSAKDVIDVLSNIAANREIAVHRIEKEKVNRAVYGLAVMNPNPEYWMAISPDAIKNKDLLVAELEDKFDLSRQDAEAFVKNIMAEPTKERFNKETGVVDRYIDTTAKYADYVLPVKIDGKDRFVFFNPKNDRSMQMVQSLRGLDVPQLGAAMQTIAPVTRFFSAINTQYNLIFGAWNFARDIQGARLNLSTTPIAEDKNAVFTGTFSAIPDIYKAVREQNADKPFSDTGDGSWDDFTRHGGKVGYKDQFARLNQSTNIVNRELAALDRGMTMSRAYKVANYISNVNDVLENATRLSAYRVALDKFKKEAEANNPNGKISEKQLEDMKARAADIAKNITVNFNRKGTFGVTAGSLYAFFNASAQGTKRLYETLSGPKGKTIMAAGIGIGIAQAIALSMAGFDEDEPTEFIKQKNLIIPTGDGKYVMWPMPFGFNIFPNLGRIFFETASKASKGQSVTPQLVNTVTMLANAFNPLGGGGLLQMVAPTVADPIVALIENKDAFGRPISRESRATSPVPGYKLSRDPSPSISQFLAEFINTITFGDKDKRGFLSPTADQIDYLGKQLGGGVYREASGILTYVSNKIQDKETPDYKVPIAGKIVGDLNSPPAISQRFYSNVIKMAEHEASIKGRIERRESVAEYMRNNPEASMWRRANTLENEISKLNRRRREMVEKQEPIERIKKLDDQKTRMMKQFNDQVRKLQ